jgi:stage V sporulation protein S
MDRFFSKLDLRDIKIDPEAKFPPDEEYVETEVPAFPQTEWNNGADADGATHAGANGLHGSTANAAAVTAPMTAIATPPQQRNGEVLKVSARSRPSAVAGAIAGVVREAGHAEVQAIGAGATNQAVKAVAIARDYLRETGIEAICLPAFIDVTIDDEDRTAIRLIVEPR